MAQRIVLSQVLGCFSLDPDGTLLVPTVTDCGEHGLEVVIFFVGGAGADYFYNLKLWLFRGGTNF